MTMSRSPIKAVLGPTNTGKTHYALERLCGHSSGVMGFPLRLLAREAYDRVVAAKGPKEVGLITGEERIVPTGARWLLCTAESMPFETDASFVAIDEAQLGADPERGHVFTDRLLHMRGRDETLILGSETIKGLVRSLVPEAEIVSRPRFSTLSYAGPKKLSRLPPRSAVIAFSADEVYAIAELLRRTRGGAAVVMGNLSPATRNAQVAMYQAGEVDFIVATDAIGMGLNMDIGHVAFASLSKFDGVRQRRLRPHEMAQIAGRAGRHQRDGSFGVALTGDPSLTFSDEEIDRIENHRFSAQSFLYWRNPGLDFASPETLLDSLALPPCDPNLRLSPEADDHAVLRRLTGELLARGERFGTVRTRRLWEACGLPDFRNSGAEFHAQTVARVFDHIGGPAGHIPGRIVAEEVARLESVQGDVPTLAGRLASIRIWAYAAWRPDWVEDPERWRERTRDVERALSDALHARLTERFVERRASRLLRDAARNPQVGDVVFHPDGEVSVLGESVGRLEGFRLVADRARGDAETRKLIAAAEARLPAEIVRRAEAMLGAPADAFHIATKVGVTPALHWRGTEVAKLARGRDLLNPRVALVSPLAALPQALRARVESRLRDALAGIVQVRLRPLAALAEIAFAPTSPASLRAFLAPLSEAGGVLPRAEIAGVVAGLSGEDRKAARSLGLTIGSLGVFHPLLLKPEAMRLRLALDAARRGVPMPPVPMPGLGLLDRPSPELSRAAASAGFHHFGEQMLRHDLVERVARAIHEGRNGPAPFRPDAHLATSLGVGGATYDRILRALGFVPVSGPEPGLWRWRGLARRAERNPQWQQRLGQDRARA